MPQPPRFRHRRSGIPRPVAGALGAVLAGASLALLVASCSDLPASGPDVFSYDVPLDPHSPWPKFRRASAQTGLSPLAPASEQGEPWTFATGKGIFSSPVIAGDDTIYIGSADRIFYALGPGGEVRWQLLTGEIIDSSALLDDRGNLYFGS